eukprot:202272-Hanusia_phi.AAC.1
MEAKEDMTKKYGDDEEQIPSLASDLSLLTRYSFAFGIPNSEVLLKAVESLLQKEKFATVEQIFQRIPAEIREASNITEVSIGRHPALVVDEDEAEDEAGGTANKDANSDSDSVNSMVNELRDLLAANKRLNLEYEKMLQNSGAFSCHDAMLLAKIVLLTNSKIA